jgi:hypothetical protein
MKLQIPPIQARYPSGIMADPRACHPGRKGMSLIGQARRVPRSDIVGALLKRRPRM